MKFIIINKNDKTLLEIDRNLNNEGLLTSEQEKIINDLDDCKIISSTIIYKENLVTGYEVVDSFEEGVNEEFEKNIELYIIKVNV